MMPGTGRRNGVPGSCVQSQCDPEAPLTQSAPSVEALLLDFDGLILDTETPVFEIWRDIYARNGQRLALDDWQHALGTHGGFDPVALLARLTGKVLDGEALASEVRERHWQACRDMPLLPGVARLLDDAARLALRLAVASSSPGSWVVSWLQHHAIRERFGAVCAREDVAAVKPAPDLFLLAAERLAVIPVACVVFEDSPNGLRAATAAGMRCVAVRNALTRPLALPPCDLELESLADLDLADILTRLGGARGGAPAVPPRTPSSMEVVR